jgi:hypothetical protein
MAGTKELFCALNCQALQFIDKPATGVKAISRIAFCRF